MHLAFAPAVSTRPLVAETIAERYRERMAAMTKAMQPSISARTSTILEAEAERYRQRMAAMTKAMQPSISARTSTILEAEAERYRQRMAAMTKAMQPSISARTSTILEAEAERYRQRMAAMTKAMQGGTRILETITKQHREHMAVIAKAMTMAVSVRPLEIQTVAASVADVAQALSEEAPDTASTSTLTLAQQRALVGWFVGVVVFLLMVEVALEARLTNDKATTFVTDLTGWSAWFVAAKARKLAEQAFDKLNPPDAT
ncbi:hypothetical protein [Actinomadura welshii]|uniref:hypothetical protein n=1 Tax=Actinomadura welshii TaxID=3103817 RepID=UPI0003AD0CD1|nr:hypothetical protein [Actinomadura madurae]